MLAPSALPAPTTSPPHSAPIPATRNACSPDSASHDHEPGITRLRRALRYEQLWAVNSSAAAGDKKGPDVQAAGVELVCVHCAFHAVGQRREDVQ